MGYGSLVMARDAAADVLCQEVEAGRFGEEKAVSIAHRIFRENSRRLYRTDEVRDRRLGR